MKATDVNRGLHLTIQAGICIIVADKWCFEYDYYISEYLVVDCQSPYLLTLGIYKHAVNWNSKREKPQVWYASLN